jgi:hypothetical protein
MRLPRPALTQLNVSPDYDRFTTFRAAKFCPTAAGMRAPYDCTQLKILSLALAQELLELATRDKSLLKAS